MSRSVKSFYPWHPTPVKTRRLFWRVAIVLSIIQLVDSQKFGNGNSHSGAPNGIPGWWFDPTLDEPKTSSSFKIKTQNFEFSYNTFHLNNNHRKANKPNLELLKNMINDAIEAKFKSLSELDRILPLGGRESIPKPMIPLDCQTRIICADRSNYPIDRITEIMKYFQGLQVLAPAYEPRVIDRTLPGDEQNLCVSDTRSYTPTSIRVNKSAPWHTVMNAPNFQQVVDTSNCINENAACGGDVGVAVTNFRTICKQQYSQRLVIVLDQNTNTPVADFFPIPDGCCCHKERIAANYEVGGRSRSHHRGGRSSKYN